MNLNIIDYLKTLLPSLSKNRITEDARMSYDELKATTIPAYKEAEKFFVSWKFRSAQMQGYEKIFKRIVKSDNDSQMIVAISRALNRIGDNSDFMQDKIEKHFESETMSTGMSCIKSNLLRILEITTFTSDYALKFLNFAYVCETSEVQKSTGYVRSNITAAQIEELEKGFNDFCFALNAIGKEKVKFSKIVDEIPDVLLDINTGQTIIGTLGENRVDPLLMRGFSAATNNPIYHIRMVIVDYQMRHYERNKETKKMLEMRLLNLQQQMEEKPDAALEHQIEYTRNRITGLDFKLKQMEEHHV